MVEMKVFGLALDETAQVPVLILKNMDESTALPIWIGAMEAMSISMVLNNVTLPRPMTHDLLLNTIRDLGCEVTAVEIISIEDGTFYAEIEIRDAKGSRRIDSRPSDAIALALRADAPIRVAEDVLREAGQDGDITKSSESPARKEQEQDKWTELLEEFDPDDKYKM